MRILRIPFCIFPVKPYDAYGFILPTFPMHSLPDHAKKVFQGEFFSVYQWQQELFDGSVATYEKIKRPDSVFVIAVKDDKICVLKEEQSGVGSFLSLPGGVLEYGEDSLAGAKRELFEEAGLVSDTWQLLETSYPHKRIEWKIYLYLAKNCRTEPNNKSDPGEKIEVHFLSFDQYLQMAFSKEFRNVDQKFELLNALYDSKKYQQLHNLYFGK